MDASAQLKELKESESEVETSGDNRNLAAKESASAAADITVRRDLRQDLSDMSSGLESDAAPTMPEQPLGDKREVDAPQIISSEANMEPPNALESKVGKDPTPETSVIASEDVCHSTSSKSAEMKSQVSRLHVESQNKIVSGSHEGEEQLHLEEYATDEAKSDGIKSILSEIDSKDQRYELLAKPQGTPPPSYQASLRGRSAEGYAKIETQALELDQPSSNTVLQNNQNQQQQGSCDPVPSTLFDQSDVKPFSTGAMKPPPAIFKDSSVHQIKWIHFNGAKVPVITQNENGPCPMIAITNVLLLRRKLTLPPEHEVVSSDLIIASLSDELLSYPTTNLDEDLRLNYEMNLSAVFSIFPKLQTGLDINVRFTGVADFEYTTALAVFDLFRIPIFHGWVADPQDLNLVKVLRNQTYNQVVEMIIDYKSSEDPERIREGLLAEEFLESAASQLTMCGLCELSERLQEGQLAVLFRNNHFNTIYKKNGRIYVLLTDVGFINERNFVWETLNNIDGDSQFVDGEFKVVTKPASPTVSPDAENPSSFLPSAPSYPTQMDLQQKMALEHADLELAKQLQEEEHAAFLKESSNDSPPEVVPATSAPPVATALVRQQQQSVGRQEEHSSRTSSTSSPSSSYQEATDLELARRLQAEEDAAYYAQQQQQRKLQQQQQRSTPGSPQPQQRQHPHRSPPSSRSSPDTRGQRQQQHQNRHQRDPPPSWKCTIS